LPASRWSCEFHPPFLAQRIDDENPAPTTIITSINHDTRSHHSRHQYTIQQTARFRKKIPITNTNLYSDVLHPNRPNVSKDELRQKLSELYKSEKDSVSVFGFRTQYGGGKSTGFALVYDSAEALKKFEPHYRKVRYGLASKIEKASRQQRTYHIVLCVYRRSGSMEVFGYSLESDG